MILLKNTTSTLKLITASATPISVAVVYEIIAGGSTPTHGGVDVQLSNITTATTTTILSAPTTGLRYEVRSIMIHNTHLTSSNAVVVNQDENGTLYKHFDCVIGGDEKLQFHRDGGWTRLNKRGVLVSDISENSLPDKTHSIPLGKPVSTSEAYGVFHFLGLSAGIIPAWAIGTSGLGGRAVVNSETGFLPLPNTSNNLILTKNLVTGTNTGIYYLVDVLFVNDGLVVTTTTAQTVNTVTLPSRDNNRSNLGAGCIWGLLVSTATTNGSAITNCTASYTNQGGTSARTATMANFPATAALGSFIPFKLADGDTSIKSIESVTLGTSLVTGAVSLCCMRLIDSAMIYSANLSEINTNRNVKIYGDECITVMVMPTSTGSYAISPSAIQVNEYV